MTKARLNKYLSNSGVCSRRKADDLISSKVVFINGVEAKLGSLVESDDLVTVNGEKINTVDKKRYYAFNKPRGVISSLSDSQGKGIKKYLPYDTHLFPVGRLGKDSEGLIILTNDGDFSLLLTHPKYFKSKVYHLEYLSKPTNVGKEGIVKQFVHGVDHRGVKYKVDSAKFIDKNKIEISLHEGKTRHIRIISGRIGLEIISLKRVSIGKLSLDKLNLSSGAVKEISKEEVL
jgi:pseudouridine synthase